MALQLHIRPLSGNTLTLTASSAETVASLTTRVRAMCGDVAGEGSAFRLCLVSGDRLTVLDESSSLTASGVPDGAMLLARRPHHAAHLTLEKKSDTMSPMFWR
ncbi:unnamed protein product [Symbiodinium natans]|uniref:Ubiquitin-like domain-containing protein n=1 Tax=Symbiodinium natans TaxID=878477 RepID=A0A812JI83_9DINO|nr:unnamed protein product [Symbiodinium natans]